MKPGALREKGRWFGRKGMEKTAQDFFDAADTIDGLLTAIEGLQKEALKYRWLLDHADIGFGDETHYTHLIPQTIGADKTIDEAIQYGQRITRT